MLPYLTEQELAELDSILSGVDIPVWSPLPGPQTEAYYCEADELFYGGAAGGGKTDLLLGTALDSHWRSIIFRREFQQLKGIRDRSQEIYGDLGKYNGADMLWRIEDGRRIEFGACQYEGDEQKYQGRPHDLKAFDEITHFSRSQFMFLKGWNRTTKIDPKTGQFYKTRVICAGNPPTTPEGTWVIDYWAPWLDPHHANPAKPGELRWFITDEEGNDREVSGPEPVYMKINGLESAVQPRSRTFIRARVQDNAYLMQSGYLSVLQSLPEPLRSRMLQGDFGVGEEDNEWQVIPTAWILLAQARWAPTYAEYLQKLADRRKEEAAMKAAGVTDRAGGETSGTLSNASRHESGSPLWLGIKGIPFAGVDTSSLLTPDQRKLNADNLSIIQGLSHEIPHSHEVGVDVSRGGRDKTVYSERIGAWFAALQCVPGVQTPDGTAVIDKLVELKLQHLRCKIDVVGVGSSPVDVGRLRGIEVVAMNGANSSVATDRSGVLGFANARSEWFWTFREALDPQLGLEIALPPDAEAAADLAATRWTLKSTGIAVEDKKKVKERIRRSPDKGDAIINAFAQPMIDGAGFLAYYREEARKAQEILNRASGGPKQ